MINLIDCRVILAIADNADTKADVFEKPTGTRNFSKSGLDKPFSRLEKNGWIERDGVGDHHRSVRYKVTKEGFALLKIN